MRREREQGPASIFFHLPLSRGRGVAKLVACWISTLLSRVGRGIFLPESTFSADFLAVSVQPPPMH